MWKFGLRPRYSFSGNICFKFSAFCLCSVSPRSVQIWGKMWPQHRCRSVVRLEWWIGSRIFEFSNFRKFKETNREIWLMRKLGSKKSRDTVPWSNDYQGIGTKIALQIVTKRSTCDHIMTNWAKSLPNEHSMLNGFPANFQTRAGTAGSWHGAGHAGRPGLVSEQVTIFLFSHKLTRLFIAWIKSRKWKPRRILRSSRPQEIFQPPQQGFFSVHAQLQLLGNIFRLFTPHLTSDRILTPNYSMLTI